MQATAAGYQQMILHFSALGLVPIMIMLLLHLMRWDQWQIWPRIESFVQAFGRREQDQESAWHMLCWVCCQLLWPMMPNRHHHWSWTWCPDIIKRKSLIRSWVVPELMQEGIHEAPRQWSSQKATSHVYQGGGWKKGCTWFHHRRRFDCRVPIWQDDCSKSYGLWKSLSKIWQEWPSRNACEQCWENRKIDRKPTLAKCRGWM